MGCAKGNRERRGGAVRALLCDRLCNCHHSLNGADDDELFGKVLTHLRRDHPAMAFPEEQLREFVAIKAYNIEYAVVYTNGEGPDEEFGPEPY